MESENFLIAMERELFSEVARYVQPDHFFSDPTSPHLHAVGREHHPSIEKDDGGEGE